MATTVPELKEWLITLDEVTLLELLGLTSEDLVDRFEDLIEDNFDRLLTEKELFQDV